MSANQLCLIYKFCEIRAWTRCGAAKSAFTAQAPPTFRYEKKQKNNMLSAASGILVYPAHFVVDYVTLGTYESGTNPKWVSGGRTD